MYQTVNFVSTYLFVNQGYLLKADNLIFLYLSWTTSEIILQKNYVAPATNVSQWMQIRVHIGEAVNQPNTEPATSQF